MSRKSLFMQHTDIPAHRTRGEVSALLTELAGVSEITHKLEGKTVTGFNFSMEIAGRFFVFSLPVRTSRVVKQLLQQRRKPPRPAELLAIEKKAERIAWRQTLRWIEAQLALVDTGLADVAEVFMPYILAVDGSTTMYEQWHGRLLGAAKKPPQREHRTNA